MSGLTILNGSKPTELVVRSGQVIGTDGQVFGYGGGEIDTRVGTVLGGRDASPLSEAWTTVWLLHRLDGNMYLTLSSRPDRPNLEAGCFKGMDDWILIGVWPMAPTFRVPFRGRVEGTGGSRRFVYSVPLPLHRPSNGLAVIPTPGLALNERVEIIVVDRSGHGVSVFDGSDNPVSDMGPIHTPSQGFGGGPPSITRGVVMTLEARVKVRVDLADSGMAEADLYLAAVYLE